MQRGLGAPRTTFFPAIDAGDASDEARRPILLTSSAPNAPMSAPKLGVRIGQLRLRLHSAYTTASKNLEQQLPLCHLTLRRLQLGGSLSNSELAQSPLEVRGHLVLGSALMVDERSAQLPMLAAMPRKQQPSAASGAQARGRSTARSSTRERENVDAGAMTSEEMAE